MKDEIKEILDKLKDGNWYEELDLTGTMWIELRWEETHILLDYITNLQEENERLKIEKQEEYNRFNLMAKFRDRALERTLIYKSRNEKANEYIKEHTNNFVEYLDVYETKELSNILEKGE